MQISKYAFNCIFEDEAVLPEYKGSTFRGVFGHALKKIVCALKCQTCEACLLRSRCLYALVFETGPAFTDNRNDGDVSLLGTGRLKPRIAAPPHPYVIEPPATDRTHFIPGDPFDFQLILFGSFNDALPYFIYAFEQMGQLGIGKKINGRKARFILNRVEAGTLPVYDRSKRKIANGLFAEEFSPVLSHAETARKQVPLNHKL